MEKLHPVEADRLIMESLALALIKDGRFPTPIGILDQELASFIARILQTTRGDASLPNGFGLALALQRAAGQLGQVRVSFFAHSATDQDLTRFELAGFHVVHGGTRRFYQLGMDLVSPWKLSEYPHGQRIITLPRLIRSSPLQSHRPSFALV